MEKPIFKNVDCVSLTVPDLDSGSPSTVTEWD